MRANIELLGEHTMKLSGACHCGRCEVVVDAEINANELAPRVCDCAYCQSNPSAMISDRTLSIAIYAELSGLLLASNGSGQATFYRCKSCNQVLAVGAFLAGESRGAVNAHLFNAPDQFAAPISVQPRLLSSTQKAQRWAKIWGQLKVCYA